MAFKSLNRDLPPKLLPIILIVGALVVFFAGLVGYQVNHTRPFAMSTPLFYIGKQPFSLLPRNYTKSGEVITHGDRQRPRIALTFDADMNPYMKDQLVTHKVESYYNKHLIDILDETNTKATLFLTGMWIELYPDATKRLSKDPLFEFGNHSYSHPSFDGYCYGLPQIGDIADREEVQHTQDLLRQVAGVTTHYFRFPGGCFGKKDLDIMKDLGMEIIHWDVVADDGFNDNTQSIINNVLNHVQNGSIIVMHMNGAPNDPKTADAVPTIIETLKNRGFVFVKVSELLGEK